MHLQMFFFKQHQDVRSLAIFRILLGVYILYDICSRLQHGRLSLLWYTGGSSSSSSSSSADHNNSIRSSFLDVHDTPHKSPIHLIWFYRGSESFQIFIFAWTGVLAICYALGYSPSFTIQRQQRKEQPPQPQSQPQDKYHKQVPVPTVVPSSYVLVGMSFTTVNVLLWFNVVAMQCRNMHVHDGSDSFTRHLLLWSCFLPMNQVWSLDSLCRATKTNNKQKQRFFNSDDIGDTQHCLAIWGIRLQIVFMYTGTVFARTFDLYGYSISNNSMLSKCEWLPPSLTAVYYSLNASFTTRDTWLGNFVRHHFGMTQFMTLSAMIVEGIVPMVCLYMNTSVQNIKRQQNAAKGARHCSTTTRSNNTNNTSSSGHSGSIRISTNDDGDVQKRSSTCNTSDHDYQYRGVSKYAYIPPFLLFKLHFGLLLLMNLPNWQFIGMIATTIWIPTSCWNNWQRRLSMKYPRFIDPPSIILQSLEMRQKKDLIEENRSEKEENGPWLQSLRSSQRKVRGKNQKNLKHHRPDRLLVLKVILTRFFFIYMMYNFAGERHWISKHDHGDVGEFLRFSQYWVMFSTPPKTSIHDIFVGTIDTSHNISTRSSNHTVVTGTNITKHSQKQNNQTTIDVWRWMKNGQYIETNINERRNQIWNNMTHVYPSPRLERLFSQWALRRNTRALRYFLDHLCLVGPFDDLTFVWQHLETTKPMVVERYVKRGKDTVFNVNCQKGQHVD